MTAPAATIANRYEIERPLGRGSFGHTWKARDVVAQRDVAVKSLDSRGAADHKVIELFEREAHVLRSMRHHGIPEIFEVIRAPWNGVETTLIVMEYVEGGSLAQIIESRRTLGSDEVMHLFLEMLSILEYIHGRVPSILHRDIKPANVILRPNGSPALVDFGSARNVFRPADEPGSTVAGTYGYMPYEQYMGQATPASDLFSLGATFLHLMTGRPPRDFMNQAGGIDVPATLPGDERLGPVIARMLRHSPGERFGSAAEVRRVVLASVGTATARVSRAPSSTTLAASAELVLGDAPRVIDGQLESLADRLAPGVMMMMSAGEDPEDSNRVFDWLTLGFFALVTVGLLPITYFAMSRSRRRRVRHFLQHGRPAYARIDSIELHLAPFDAPMAKVRFAFEADGRTHRASDIVMPDRAERWREGEDVRVLYDPNRDYAAIVIA